MAEIIISPNTIANIRQSCKMGLDNGWIDKQQFDEIIKRAKQAGVTTKAETPNQTYLSKRDLQKRYGLKSGKAIEAWVSSGKLKATVLSPGVLVPTKNGNTRRAGGTVRFKLEDVEKFELEHFQG